MRQYVGMAKACTTPPCDYDAEPRSLPRRAGLLGVLSLSFACVALDNTKFVLAVPTLAGELGAASSTAAAAVNWAVEANLIVYASLLLLGGALSERFGARRVLLGGLALFTAGTLAAAAATSLAGLCAGRAVAGLGAALLVPASLAALEHVFGAGRRARAIAIWTASFGAAAALGPVFGGVLLERWGWRAALLGNLPFALLALAGARELVPAALPRRSAPLDLLGTALAFGATVCTLVGLLGGVPPGVAALALAAGAGGYALLVLWERRARHPMLHPELFRRPAFAPTLIVILLAYLAFSGLSFSVAQYLQVVRGHPPGVASLLNLPLPLSMLVGTLLAPELGRKVGAGRALASSLALAFAGAVFVAVACAIESDAALCAALVPFAAGAGSAFASVTVAVLGSAPVERAGSAAAISESAFELGGVIGIALLGTRLGELPGAAGTIAAAVAAAVALTLALRFSRRARGA